MSRSLDTIAREHTEAAINTLVDAMDNADSWKDRLSAAKEILDRGHGKPLQATITIPATKRVQRALYDMSEEDLQEAIEAETGPLPALPPPLPRATLALPKQGDLDHSIIAADPLLA